MEGGDVTVVTQKSGSKNSPLEGQAQQPPHENLQLSMEHSTVPVFIPLS